MRAADGLLLRCDVSWATFGADENRVRIIGDRGGADYWPEANGLDRPMRLYAYDSKGNPADTVVADVPSDHSILEPAWSACVADFVTAVASKSRPAATGQDGLIVAELIERAYAKASNQV